MPDPLPVDLLNALDTGFARLDAESCIQYANPAFAALCERKNLDGAALTAALGAAPHWVDDAAQVSVLRDGSELVEITLRRASIDGGVLVTARTGPSASQLAAQARKIIHDINNQLQIISISAGSLVSITPVDTPSWEDATEINDAVEKANRMLGRLQQFARSVPEVTSPEPAEEPLSVDQPAILLVESHARIGEATARVLNRSGYRATAVTSPDTAIELFATGVERWAMAILSMRLKHTTGVDLARILRRADPKLPVILCVAGDALPDAATLQSAGIATIIQKPFSHAELTQAVKKLL